MSMAAKEWRTTPSNWGVRHVVEIVYGGQFIFYCTQTIASPATATIDITEDTPLTCLWCAAWWHP